MPHHHVLALDLTKLYQSSLNEDDQQRKVESVTSYRKIERSSPGNDRNRLSKYRNKTPIQTQNHDLELSCTERISRQKYSAGNHRKYPLSAREADYDRSLYSVNGEPSFMNVKNLQSSLHPQHPQFTGAPVKVLEERANRAPKIPHLSKVDILPALGGYELEYSDSVEEPEVGRQNHFKNQSIISMMSSLSGTSAVDEMVMPSFGDFGDLHEKSQFEVPRKKKTADAPVFRNDRDWRRQEEIAMNREFKDFQLVKQLAGGASIMRGVSYRRGVKGTNIAQRYQSNLEKIMFIKNVYEHRDFRDTYPRETKKQVKKADLGLQYQFRNGETPGDTSPRVDQVGKIMTPYSFIHGPPDEKQHINANLQSPTTKNQPYHQGNNHNAGAEGSRREGSSPDGHQYGSPPPSGKPVVRVPMIVPSQPHHHQNNNHHSSHHRNTNSPSIQEDTIETAPTVAHAVAASAATPSVMPASSPVSPSPTSAKPGQPSFRTQKLHHHQQQQQHLHQHPQHPQSAPQTAELILEEMMYPAAVHGIHDVPSVPKASELLPESLNLDPSMHLDVENTHLVNQRSPHYKLDDGATAAGISTAMMMMNGLIHHPQQPQSHVNNHPASPLYHHHHYPARRHASPSSSIYHHGPSSASVGVGHGQHQETAASVTASSNISNNSAAVMNRSTMLGSGGAKLLISPTSSIDVTTAAFAQNIQHHQAFMSSQMRRVKHDSRRSQHRNLLAFDDHRQDTLAGQPIPQPRQYSKSTLPHPDSARLKEASSLAGQGQQMSVATMDPAQAALLLPGAAQNRSPKSIKIQSMIQQRDNHKHQQRKVSSIGANGSTDSQEQDDGRGVQLSLMSAPSTAPHNYHNSNHLHMIHGSPGSPVVAAEFSRPASSSKDGHHIINNNDNKGNNNNNNNSSSPVMNENSTDDREQLSTHISVDPLLVEPKEDRDNEDAHYNHPSHSIISGEENEGDVLYFNDDHNMDESEKYHNDIESAVEQEES